MFSLYHETQIRGTAGVPGESMRTHMVISRRGTLWVKGCCAGGLAVLVLEQYHGVAGFAFAHLAMKLVFK